MIDVTIVMLGERRADAELATGARLAVQATVSSMWPLHCRMEAAAGREITEPAWSEALG